MQNIVCIKYAYQSVAARISNVHQEGTPFRCTRRVRECDGVGGAGDDGRLVGAPADALCVRAQRDLQRRGGLFRLEDGVAEVLNLLGHGAMHLVHGPGRGFQVGGRTVQVADIAARLLNCTRPKDQFLRKRKN